jgi:hypothetical protein
MGLKEKLETEGSAFTYPSNGTEETPYPSTYTPPINPLATDQSSLHAQLDGTPGYSLTGDFASEVNAASATYKDGHPGGLPPIDAVSTEDLNGIPPTIANHNNFSPNSSTQALPYLNNLPL